MFTKKKKKPKQTPSAKEKPAPQPEPPVQPDPAANRPPKKEAARTFRFKVMDPAVKTYESTIEINEKIRKLKCENGIITTKDQELAEFLNSQPMYRMD